MLEKGANIHARSDYALKWSSYNGHIEIVKFLIEKGTNIHPDNDYALRLSSYNGHFEVVKYLIKKVLIFTLGIIMRLNILVKMDTLM